MLDFDNIFRRYHTPLLLYALKFVRCENIALDLLQDVFMLILEKKKLNLNEEHLKAYLFNAVRNTCFNYLKHEKVAQKYQQRQMWVLTDLELKHYENGEKSLIEKENLNKIYNEINSLSDIHREVIELSRFEGLKNKEIAERLNIPIRTVETRLFRALSSLRKKLSKKSFPVFLLITEFSREN